MDTEQFVGHTEAPWDFELYGDEGTIFAPSKMIPDPEGLSICGLHNLNQTGEQMVSNGMLMAASPELLERVKELEKELAEEKENFRLFRDSVVRPVLKHVYSRRGRGAWRAGDVVTVLIESDDGNYSRTFIFRDLTVADDFRKRVIPIMQKRGYAVYHAILAQSNDSVESAIENSTTIRDLLEEE
jgi:hypothetical protein